MTVTANLLIEIGTEELPPKALRELSECFMAGVAERLAKLGFQHGPSKSFATPRRLALSVHALPSREPTQTLLRKGPAVTAAFDTAGQPTQAARGFARQCGVPVETLARETSAKGAWLAYPQTLGGRSLDDLLPGLIHEALAALPIPKRMRWGDFDVEFVRPVHWVVLLHGDRVIPGTVLGVASGRVSRGHRFQGAAEIELRHADEYEARLLNEGRVIVDFAARMAKIREGAEALAEAVDGMAEIDETLLQEVAALTEWPVPLRGSFEARFLAIPPEVLVKTMQGHQKYFPIRDAAGQLMPYFIAVANLESRDPDSVRAGNERVIRPRFADAAFFWEQDRRQPLEQAMTGLKNVVFQVRLGSLWDKSQRCAAIACRIAETQGWDPVPVERAAKLAKCDLLSNLVGEFPELQGTMGRYLAEASGESPAIAQALEEQYWPKGGGDRLPGNPVAQALALADRADTLVGIFAVGERPSGTKDPFGLRRAALGILRICIEGGVALDVRTLLDWAADQLEPRVAARAAVADALAYLLDRLPAYYADRGVPADAVEAVRALALTSPGDIHRRIEAVGVFRELPEAQALAAAHKRIHNLLRKAGEETPGVGVLAPEWFTEAAESLLLSAVTAVRGRVDPLLACGDYRQALIELASLRGVVDRFFDEVMVMVEDEQVRAHRLALLRLLRSLFLGIADISRLQTGPA
ncbi:MAG: glycine--tRNA ligase subunit beta [Pseudomonadota bacterium]